MDNHTTRFGKKTRTYLLTASNFEIVCKRKDTTLSDNLIKLLRAYKDLPVHKIPSIHHGQKYEAKARRCYAKEHLKTCGCNVSVGDMGLYISLKYHFLGASVDGIIACSKCGVGTLEIKCPLECASNKSLCAQIDEKKKTLILKMDHNYYYLTLYTFSFEINESRLSDTRCFDPDSVKDISFSLATKCPFQ